MKSAFDLMFFILVGLAFFGNIYFYKMKSLLKEKGYPMNLFWGHIRDLWNMTNLIKLESNSQKRKEYCSLYMKVLGTLILFMMIACFHIKIG
jgi:hypothetical protein